VGEGSPSSQVTRERVRFFSKRYYVLMQQFNAILLHDGFESADHPG